MVFDVNWQLVIHLTCFADKLVHRRGCFSDLPRPIAVKNKNDFVILLFGSVEYYYYIYNDKIINKLKGVVKDYPLVLSLLDFQPQLKSDFWERVFFISVGSSFYGFVKFTFYLEV